MKIKLLFFLLFVAFKLYSQEYVFGKISTDEGVEIKHANIVNLQTDEHAVSDEQGNYMIRASSGQELRFTKSRYERVAVKITTLHFSKPLNVILNPVSHKIEEIEIKYQATGNLKEDVKHFGDRGKVKIMKREMADYVQRKSDRSVLAPRPGEFVQPVGPGFSVGSVKNRWDDLDFMVFLIKELGEDFFIVDLKITKPEIQSFILYVLRDFEKKNILKYGQPTPADTFRFTEAAYKKMNTYKKK